MCVPPAGSYLPTCARARALEAVVSTKVDSSPRAGASQADEIQTGFRTAHHTRARARALPASIYRPTIVSTSRAIRPPLIRSHDNCTRVTRPAATRTVADRGPTENRATTSAATGNSASSPFLRRATSRPSSSTRIFGLTRNACAGAATISFDSVSSGTPHRGQLGALSDISALHSGHAFIAMPRVYRDPTTPGVGQALDGCEAADQEQRSGGVRPNFSLIAVVTSLPPWDIPPMPATGPPRGKGKCLLAISPQIQCRTFAGRVGSLVEILNRMRVHGNPRRGSAECADPSRRLARVGR